jgi:hypothetical protein
VKPSVWPSASAADGWKEYAAPTVALVDGVPEIVGARLGTVMVNAGSEAVAMPSFTLITMFAYELPACAAPTVPLSRPVVVLKVAHEGRFETVKRNVSPFASAAVG